MEFAPKLNWIDTHCHAYANAFAEDREAAVERAFEAGVERILLPNIDAASVQPLLDLVAAYPERCFPMMGLHPCHVEENWEAECVSILGALDAEPCIAVGEIGMDLFRGKETRWPRLKPFTVKLDGHWSETFLWSFMCARRLRTLLRCWISIPAHRFVGSFIASLVDRKKPRKLRITDLFVLASVA